MTNWYDKYVGIPFKHLGSDIEEGLDCFNLCRYVLNAELNIHIPYYTYDFCNIVDDHWYAKTTIPLLEQGANKQDENWSWLKVATPKKLDVVLMSIGSTNITNHTALYLGGDKLLQTTINRASWVSPYGRYYKQYTTGIYRWNIT